MNEKQKYYTGTELNDLLLKKLQQGLIIGDPQPVAFSGADIELLDFLSQQLNKKATVDQLVNAGFIAQPKGMHETLEGQLYSLFVSDVIDIDGEAQTITLRPLTQNNLETAFQYFDGYNARKRDDIRRGKKRPSY